MDIWQRLVTRDMPHGHLELLDRAADEIARLQSENKRMRLTLEIIAGRASDKLQAAQAKAALDNIG